MVVYCHKCGSQLAADNSIFCSRCGTKLSVSSPQHKESEVNDESLNLNEIVDNFSNLMNGAFSDIDKLDEITAIKYFIRIVENDIKNDIFSRKFRTNRILMIQGILREQGFDIRDNTVEYLYDSIISDMDLHKISNHSILHHNKFDFSVKKDETGPAFFDFMCLVCDNNVRVEIAEDYLKDNSDLEIICPHCSYIIKILQSTFIKQR
jgi:DNA-directed RNA polymerase subunit RPC12/RpoP